MDNNIENLSLSDLMEEVEKISSSDIKDLDKLNNIKKELEKRLPANQRARVRESEKVMSRANSPEELKKLEVQELERLKDGC